jgi:hypothetical protein
MPSILATDVATAATGGARRGPTGFAGRAGVATLFVIVTARGKERGRANGSNRSEQHRSSRQLVVGQRRTFVVAWVIDVGHTGRSSLSRTMEEDLVECRCRR